MASGSDFCAGAVTKHMANMERLLGRQLGSKNLRSETRDLKTCRLGRSLSMDAIWEEGFGKKSCLSQ